MSRHTESGESNYRRSEESGGSKDVLETVDQTITDGKQDKEYHHPLFGKYKTDGTRSIPNLVTPWDGKQVWAVADKKEGMWRQATIIAAVVCVCVPVHGV